MSCQADTCHICGSPLCVDRVVCDSCLDLVDQLSGLAAFPSRSGATFPSADPYAGGDDISGDTK